MSFPASPVLNEVFIAGGKAWKFDGTNWVIPQKASTLPWELVTGKPTYFPADWSSTVANIPNYFNAKVISSEFPPTNQVTGTIWWDEVNQRLYVYQSNVWVETSVALREKFITIDPDVINYVTAVETADGAPLEQDVVTAYEAFILGCKIDGIWDSIKASCILAGARTLAGAIIPLAGIAPVNVGFASSAYNRKTGLKGGTPISGRLSANRVNNADPTSSKHLAVFITESPARDGTGLIIGHGEGAYRTNLVTTATDVRFHINSASSLTSNVLSDASPVLGLFAASRNSSSTISAVLNGAAYTFTNTALSAGSEASSVLNRNDGGRNSNARISFYSIGESIDLAKLDNRVTKLMTTLSTVIP